MVGIRAFRLLAFLKGSLMTLHSLSSASAVSPALASGVGFPPVCADAPASAPAFNKPADAYCSALAVKVGKRLGVPAVAHADNRYFPMVGLRDWSSYSLAVAGLAVSIRVFDYKGGFCLCVLIDGDLVMHRALCPRGGRDLVDAIVDAIGGLPPVSPPPVRSCAASVASPRVSSGVVAIPPASSAWLSDMIARGVPVAANGLQSVFTAGAPVNNLDAAFSGGAAPLCHELLQHLANDNQVKGGIYKFTGSRLHWQDGIGCWSGLVDGLPVVAWSKNLRGKLSVSVFLLKDGRCALACSYDGAVFADITCDTFHDVWVRARESKDDLHKLFWSSVVNPVSRDVLVCASVSASPVVRSAPVAPDAPASSLTVAVGDGVPARAIGKEKQFFVRADVAPSVDNGKPVNGGVRFWAFDKASGQFFYESVPLVVKASELAFVVDHVLSVFPMMVQHTDANDNVSAPFFVGRWDYDNNLDCFEPSVPSAGGVV